MPPIGFSSKALNVEETARILPGTYDLSLEPSWGTLEMTVHANGTHEPGNTVTIEYGKMKISNKSNLIERLRKIMIENLEDWNETKNDSDSTFRADQMTWEVTSIQQVPHDYSLLAFDAKGSFPYTFLTFQRTKKTTRCLSEDPKIFKDISSSALTSSQIFQVPKAPRPRYLSPNTISIQSLSTIGARLSSHTPKR